MTIRATSMTGEVGVKVLEAVCSSVNHMVVGCQALLGSRVQGPPESRIHLEFGTALGGEGVRW